jgi:xylulokinase
VASPNDFVLGIDLGTGSTKCLVIDAEGRCLARASRTYRTYYPIPGYAEQDPHEWFPAVVAAVREAVQHSGIDACAISSIGICGAAHIPVLLDDELRVLRPAILWTDQRSTLEVQDLLRDYGDDILETSYNQANCTWTLPQLMWVGRNEPATLSRVRHLLVAKDYMVFKFTGTLAADSGSAASTLMVNAGRKEWSSWLCELSGLPRNAFPPVFSPRKIVGHLTSECAKALGLRPEVKVIAGALDSAMELLGNGVIRPSEGIVRLGTAGAVMVIVQRPRPDPTILTYPHVVGDYWYHQAGTNSCATALQWVRDLVGFVPAQDEEGLSYVDLDLLASPVPPGCDGLVFHPYLLGERAPYWDPNLRASFTGMSLAHRKGHFIRAVQEGVAFSLRDCLESLLQLGFDVDELKLGGGGGRSALWSQILCDVLGLPAAKTKTDDSAFGVAMLAATAVGLFRDLEDAVETCVVDEERIIPDPERSGDYSRIFREYREIHDALAPVYTRRSAMQSLRDSHREAV